MNSLKNKATRFTLLTLVALLVLTPLSPAPATADTAWPVTVHTELQLPAQTGASDIAALWLASLRDETSHASPALGLVLTQDETSWFPTWKLQLRSHTGLLGALQAVDLTTMPNIPWQHHIQSVFSYDPLTGAVSVWVWDETAEKSLYVGHTTVQPESASLTAAAALETAKGEFIALTDVAVQPRFIPRAVQWGIVYAQNGRYDQTRTTRIDRTKTGALSVKTAQAGQGTFRLIAKQQNNMWELARLAGPEANGVHPLPLNTLPPGNVTLLLEYTEQGATTFSESLNIVVGQVEAAITDVQIKQENNSLILTGTARIHADGPLPAFNLMLDYEVKTPTRNVPLHSGWHHTAGRAAVQAPPTEADPIELSFAIPLPPSHPNDMEQFVSISPRLSIDVPLAATGPQRFALGQRSPAFPSVAGYHVLRADLHTHTTLSDGSLLPPDRVWESYEYGYDVIALTDHRTHRGYDLSIDLANRIGLILLRGLETGRRPGLEHFAVVGIDADYAPRDEHSWALRPGEDTVYYQDQVETIIQHGGMIFYAHAEGHLIPDDLRPDHPDVDLGWTDAIDWMVRHGYLQGVDVRGHYSAYRRDAPFRWALEHHLTLIDVSDIHDDRDPARASHSPITFLFAEERSAQGALDALRNGRTVIWRNEVMRGHENWLTPFIHAMVHVSLINGPGGPSVRFHNLSPLPLDGIAILDGTSSQHRLPLEPLGEVLIPVNHPPAGLEVIWLNVLKAPDTALRTEHTVDMQ